MLALLLAATLGFLSPASEPRVAVVAASTTDGLVASLAGELGTLGFDSEIHVDADVEVTLVELRQIARDEGVAAAIWISPDRSEVVVWVDDRGKGRAIVRELPGVDEGATDEVVVLRVVELLRASLREAQGQAPETEAKPVERPVEPPPAPATPRERRPRWYVDLGPAIAVASGGVGPSAQLAASIRAMPHPTIGARVFVLVPTLAPRVEGTGGSARISVAHVVGGPHLALRAHDKVVQPDLGVLAGVSIVRMDGRADPPFVAGTDHVVTFNVRLGAGVAFAFHRNLAVRLDAGFGATAPAPQVAFGSSTIARWGPLYATGAVALEARFGAK